MTQRIQRHPFLALFDGADTNASTGVRTSSLVPLQALYLMNNQFIADRTSLEKNRTLATLAEQRTTTARKVASLYLAVLSRKPRPDETKRFVKYIESGGPKKDSKEALADVFWSLLNSAEFLLNH